MDLIIWRSSIGLVLILDSFAGQTVYKTYGDSGGSLQVNETCYQRPLKIDQRYGWGLEVVLRETMGRRLFQDNLLG